MEHQERILNAINELALGAKGSLWLIKDTAWERVIHGFVRKRQSHPAMIFANRHYESLNDTVPLMIGSSRKGCGLRLKAAMPGSHPGKPYTYFSVVRPCPTVSADAMAIKRFTGLDPEVERNHQKPYIEDDEFYKLDCYLASKGVTL